MVTMLTNLIYLRRSKISYQYKQIQQMFLIYICDSIVLTFLPKYTFVNKISVFETKLSVFKS